MKDVFDYWSIPHFLFGVVAALFSVLFGVPFPVAFSVTLSIAVLWELLEMRFRLKEAPWNVASDIILPLIAFPVTFFAVERVVDPNHRFELFFIAAGIYLYTNYAAWRARMEGDRDFLS